MTLRTCTDRIVSAIEGADTSTLVVAFSFTSSLIAQTLAKASERGIKVKALHDKSQFKERHSLLSLLLQKGIPVFINLAAGIACNKVKIFDEVHALA